MAGLAFASVPLVTLGVLGALACALLLFAAAVWGWFV